MFPLRLDTSCTLFLLLVLSWGAASPSVAQQIALPDRGPSLNAHPLQSALTLDGVLDEPVWQEAEYVDQFLQADPAEGLVPSQRTEVRVLYDDRFVYIGASMYDANPENIQRAMGRRDQENRADWIFISVDAYLDRKTAYVFGVNAAGVQFDAVRTGGFGRPDESWDAIWGSNVAVTPDGWFAEMRIPYSMLRFNEADSQTWGIHVERRIPVTGEEIEWPLGRRVDRGNMIAHYALLQNLEGVSPRRNIQVQPYTVSRVQSQEHDELPGETARNQSMDIGGDLKMGLGSNITLDATINPDFGQVESDPAQLNLSAFETFFDERRPFFVEGVQIYEFDLGQGGDLLYTRRIGAQGPIIGATKLSGRSASGLSFGVMAAATGDQFDPERMYGVARLSQQLGVYSSAGGILTVYEGPLDEGRRRSMVGGADWDIRFLDNAYSLEGFTSVTRRHAPGDEQTGFAGSLRIDRRQGAIRFNTGVRVYDDQFNPNDAGRLNRNNFISLDAGSFGNVKGGQPFWRVQNMFVGVNGGQNWSYVDRLNLGANARVFVRWNSIKRFQRMGFDLGIRNPFGGYDLFETRGLWARAEATTYQVHTEFRTDQRRPWNVRFDYNHEWENTGGTEQEFRVRGTWNVGTRITLNAQVSTEWENDRLAWSSNETLVRSPEGWRIGEEQVNPDDLAPHQLIRFNDQGQLNEILSPVTPYDDRGFYYVPIFGERDTRSVDFTLRSGIAFSPKLTLQLYGQFFVARGQYDQFQVLQDPDHFASFSAFPKRDDFAFSSFQTNTVVRWEYRPGSTIHVVWSHGRRADAVLNPLAPEGPSPFDTTLQEHVSDTFEMIPSNVFLIKLNYTFLR